MTQPSHQRVAMAKAGASRCVSDISRGEYRFSMFGFGTSGESRKFSSLLKSWRDGKVRVASLSPIPDLGVKDMGDHVEVWSSDQIGLAKLSKWVESRGLDSTFIW